MKLLVTGGNGFIGSNFIEYALNNQTNVERLVNIDVRTPISSDWIDEVMYHDDRYSSIQADICNIEEAFAEKEESFDFCVHFAAESHVDNSIVDDAPFIRTNIQGTLAVAKFCAKRHITMIHISTDEVYGHLEDLKDPVFTTASPLQPRNPYAASKASAELMLDAFANTDMCFEYYVIRPSNNYGPHQDKTKFIPKMLEKICVGEYFPMYGKGDFFREWTWVTDTVRAILFVIENGPWEDAKRFNVSSGEIMSNIDMYMKTLDIFRSRGRKDYVGKIDFIKDPRGNAHDKIYSIENSINLVYVDVNHGMEQLVADYLEEKDFAGE